MDLEEIRDGSFDPVDAIRHLAGEVEDLKTVIVTMGWEGIKETVGAPTMDASDLGVDNRDEDLLAVLFGERAATLLHGAGLHSINDLRAATDEELIEIDGIGPATLGDIRQKTGEA